MEKTTDYDLFTLRDDNRAKIDESHVVRLMNSINIKNMLDLRPILVNSKLEIIDGQHRFEAAKRLGVPIYYKVESSLTGPDIVQINISKPWNNFDYLNYWIKHHNVEYQKLDRFIRDNKISLRIGLAMTVGHSKKAFDDFRLGKFVFNQDDLTADIFIVHETNNIIKKHHGQNTYTDSTRFWKALMGIIKHPNFCKEKWFDNLKRFVGDIYPKASIDDYRAMMLKIYNWNNRNGIH
jgi:hypothetical protein